jgi:hypothetical protein
MLNYSAEIRWFLHGPIPGAMADWFAIDMLGSEPEERSDDYILLPLCPTAGIKLREGRLQVKSQCREPSPLMITSEINGWASSWVKWSLELTSASTRNFYRKNETIRVQKKRWRRKLTLDNDFAEEVATGSHAERGCTMELAALQVEADSWWSLALESFGQPPDIQESLQRCILHFLRRSPPPIRLLASDSKSYSEWLELVGRGPSHEPPASGPSGSPDSTTPPSVGNPPAGAASMRSMLAAILGAGRATSATTGK